MNGSLKVEIEGFPKNRALEHKAAIFVSGQYIYEFQKVKSVYKTGSWTKLKNEINFKN